MTHVLLLNASYEPLATLPLRRAISLWLRGRVTPASPTRISIPTPDHTVNVPTVIRLQRYVQVPKRRATWSRAGVFHRDQMTCIYCGARPGDRQNRQILTSRDFTIDHIIPKSRGGRNSWVNTACACARCNHRKAARTPHEAGMTMRWEPKTPRVNYLILSGEIPEGWKVYLETGH